MWPPRQRPHLDEGVSSPADKSVGEVPQQRRAKKQQGYRQVNRKSAGALQFCAMLGH